MSQFAAAIASLATTLKGLAGDSGVYSRGGRSSAAITAVLSMNEYEVLQDDGILTFVKSYDWIFSAADLVIDDDTLTPTKGDRWTVTINSVQSVYEVQPVGPNRPVSEPHDPTGTMIVVHTKKVG